MHVLKPYAQSESNTLLMQSCCCSLKCSASDKCTSNSCDKALQRSARPYVQALVPETSQWVLQARLLGPDMSCGRKHEVHCSTPSAAHSQLHKHSSAAAVRTCRRMMVFCTSCTCSRVSPDSRHTAWTPVSRLCAHTQLQDNCLLASWHAGMGQWLADPAPSMHLE